MCLCKLQRACVNFGVSSQIRWQPIPEAVVTAEVMLPHTVGVMVAFQLLILKNTLVIASSSGSSIEPYRFEPSASNSSDSSSSAEEDDPDRLLDLSW